MGDGAHGILAQSVGGGGGNGGFSFAGTISASGSASLGASVSLGGDGAAGSSADNVTVDSNRLIYTTGDQASAIVAQSVGGGGGNGGWSLTADVPISGGTAGSVGVSLGGDGATGGDVVVNARGELITEGDGSTALIAQSVGGGGGNGGFGFSGSLAAGSNALSANIALGGDGGIGGAADDVDVTTRSMIYTMGDEALGILAQSIGGGGGNGGWSGTGSLALGSNAGTVGVSLGGDGGEGGVGGDVTVNVRGAVGTEGDGATAVLAQSVGGGGGNAGFAVSGSLVGGQNALAVNVALGGEGGEGNDAGNVTLRSSDLVSTLGDNAHGLAAQSIGGGGGRGGFSVTGTIALGSSNTGGIGVSLGGEGGDGGDGGAVIVDNIGGDISTFGDLSHAILAQSVGGGGGDAGFAVSGTITFGSNSVGGSVGVGGEGGDGGDGATVDVINDALLYTEGDNSYGILAQSIGGGGGTGGFSLAGSAGLSNQTAIAANVTIGGQGGAAGEAGDVTVNMIGDLSPVALGDGSHGILAQSIGGGGGDGGFTVSGSLSGGTNGRNINVGIGGSGGAAGDGGSVTINRYSDESLITAGAISHGILAQSIGGGGGSGGFAGAFSGNLATSDSVNLGVTVGGAGAGGGDGGLVTIDHGADITTYGDGSHGIFAQSIGGGGGNGGSTYSGSLSGSSSTNLNVAIGGSGGIGGLGGEVIVDHRGTILTYGDASYGIFAQSVGGGGGQGGYAGGLSVTGSNSNAFTLSVGGEAGDGSEGGDVTVNVSGEIVTFGELSHAVVAQSIGGGGGQGGMVGVDEDIFGAFLTGSTNISFGQNTNNLTVSIGGTGGIGGHGGDVEVTNNALLFTEGAGAYGIYAQSIGGGGGDGGNGLATSGSVGAGRNGAYSIALGGSGGAAGDGGLVDVINNAQIYTLGGAAHGIVAQSIGGGGGNGGDAGGFVTAYTGSDNDRNRQNQISVSIGGSGGVAGDGGDVTVDNNGLIVTEGDHAYGVFAQSIGGGGGQGGLVSQSSELTGYFIDLANQGEDGYQASINIGGSGGASGDGGMVTVTNAGDIYTLGALGAHGIFAQSIGGGGGDGGSGLAGTIAIGGDAGAGGDGGAISITNTGDIVTTGSIAHGIFAQSVGGGGGTGGNSDYGDDPAERSELEQLLADATTAFEFVALLESFGDPQFTLNIGGQGGAAGDGGDIFVLNEGSITTLGDYSSGIYVQSIGGGGGTGGVGSVGAVGDITLPGFGGAAGDGGDITVIHTGDITTYGAGAYGIFAQSVGGGGGVAGDYSFGFGDITENVQLIPFTGGNGDGGDVTVLSSGNITVLGHGALGIFAQSVGGGGGLVGITGDALSLIGSFGGQGEAGTVTVVHNGDVITPDQNAIAVFSQSDAQDGTDDIEVTLDSDVRGGSLYGIGVLFEGGSDNVLNTSGSVSAVSGQAITATGGNDTVNNSGLVIGNVDLGEGDNAFNNLLDSNFIAFDTIDLGGGVFTNEGGFVMGLSAPIVPIDLLNGEEHGNFDEEGDPRFNLLYGARVINEVDLTGDFVQTEDGSLVFDIAFGPYESDVVNVSGDATVDGVGDVTLTWLENAEDTPLFNVGGTATDNGLEITDTIAIDYGISATADAINLTIDTAFGIDELNRNGRELGDHMDSQLQVGGAFGTGRLLALLGNLQDQDTYSPCSTS